MPKPEESWTDHLMRLEKAHTSGKFKACTIGSTAMSSLMKADYRNAGRPTVRTLTTTSGAPIVRTYGYDTTTSQSTI